MVSISSQDLSLPVAARARAPGFYEELSSPDQTPPPPPPSAGDAAVNGAELLYCLGHDTPDRKARHLVRNSPLKQKLVDLLGLDKQSVDNLPEQGYPSRCCTPFFVWKTLLRSLLFNIKFTIQRPADLTNATTVSPSLQAVRESQFTLSTFMASKISEADQFALTIPAERVTLRIANAAVVSGTFTSAITPAHRLPSLRLHQCTRKKWTASTYSNIHWSAFSQSFKKRKLKPRSSGCENSPTAG
jgi:hypothetical protein